MTTGKNIFLIGFMGAGKTSVGRMLSKETGLDFVDLDDFIEKKLRMTIPEIFSQFGELFFRDAESDALRYIAQKKGRIVATGGGVVLREENWKIMGKEGITIYLEASAEILWSRVKNNKSRPLLQVESPFDRVRELLSQRTLLYEKADLIVDTENISPQKVSQEIIRKLKVFRNRLNITSEFAE